MLFVNAKVTNFAIEQCATCPNATGVVGWIRCQWGSRILPYSCIDVLGISLALGNTVTEKTCVGIVNKDKG